MLLAPTAVSAPATATVDMRDTAPAIAARATSPQLKVPFHALSLNSHPVNTAAFAATINTIMTDIHHSNWIADVH
jgi:hypothetical protein